MHAHSLTLAQRPAGAMAGLTRLPGAFHSQARSSADSPAERVVGIEPQRRLARDVRRPRDGRHDLALGAVAPSIARGENAADHALLNPLLALGKAPLRRETGELRAGTRSAR